MTTPNHSIADCLVDLGVVSSTKVEAATAVFAECDTLQDEFKLIKKAYFRTVLQSHPDKGGDAKQFRRVQTSFEVVRDLFQNQRVPSGGFASYFSNSKCSPNDDFPNWEDLYTNFCDNTEVPSYDHFADAAEEEVPGYRVELARSKRSQCVKCARKPGKKGTTKPKGQTDETTTTTPSSSTASSATASSSTALVVATTGRITRSRSGLVSKPVSNTTTLATPVDAPPPAHFIPKGEIRVGSLNDESGSYGRWNHLPCWRVPSRVWSGLTQPENAEAVLQDLLRMEEVLLTGLADLDKEQQIQFVQHVMDRKHWAKKYKTKKNGKSTNKRAPAPAAPPEESASSKRPKNDTAETPANNEEASKAVVVVKERFVIPRPGVNGAIQADGEVAGKRFVLTGVFPEVGGGAGLNQGKDKVKRMIEDFGGRVTGSVSGKTDYLVVGKAPGASKVGNAHGRGVPLVDLRRLQNILLGNSTLLEVQDQPPPRIEAFSAGYPTRRIEY